MSIERRERNLKLATAALHLLLALMVLVSLIIFFSIVPISAEAF